MVTSKETEVIYYKEYTLLRANVIINNPIIKPPYNKVIKNNTKAE